MIQSAAGPLRLGIIGCGRVVEDYHLPVLVRMPDVRLTWLCDSDLPRAVSLAKIAGGLPVRFEVSACEDVDAVLVAIPVGGRRDVVGQCVARGWHALCEKPFAPAVADHEWMLQAADAAGVQLGVGLMRRHYGATRAARDVVRSGVLGRVLRVWGGEGGRLHRTGRKTWYLSDSGASGGGALFESGSHLVDQVLGICGITDARVGACRQARWAGMDLDTLATANATLEAGGAAQLEIRVSMVEDVFNGIVVDCETGRLVLGTGPEAVVELQVDGNRVARLNQSTGSASALAYAAFRDLWLDFVARCTFGGQRRADTGLATTRFLEDCQVAAAKQAAPTVPL